MKRKHLTYSCALLALALISGCAGRDGKNGAPGVNGQAGADGSSCTVSPAANGSLLSCSDGTSVVILNGTDGEDGQNAQQSAYAVTELIDPCGDGPGYDEILLRLANGKLMAHYSHGSLQFLTLLTPGTYQTTDGTKCRFTVNSDLSVTW